MGLLAPWFLLGLLGLGLPVWLHLLRRRHNPPRPFPSLMFFERRPQSSIRQRRLRYWGLLLLRCLLLAALVLAFARPYRRVLSAGAAERLMVLALDESFSMRQADRMARARRAAMELLGKARPGERVEVIAFASRVRVLSQPSSDPAAARAAIGSLEPTYSSTSYGELVRSLRLMAEAWRGSIEVHVFTDLQRSGLPPSFQDLALPARLHLQLHPVAADSQANWTVESVSAPACVYQPRSIRIQANIACFGAVATRKRASLLVNGRVLETRDTEVPARGRAPVEFLLTELPHGVNRAEVRIEPPDAFPDDDRRVFAIERLDPRPALFVHEPSDRRSLLYFRTALEASGQSPFRLEEALPEQMAVLKPGQYAFVVLSDVGWLPEAFARALRSYLETGGAVLLTAGPSTIAHGKMPLVGAPIHADGELAGAYQAAWEIDRQHPALAGTGSWEAVKFYRTARLEAGDGRVLARLADRAPLLIEKRVGAGRLLIFASSFDNVANDFPLHAAFVPFIERLTAYLGGLEERAASLPVDAHFALRLPSERGIAVEVIGPGGGRVISLKESATADSVELKQAGYYEIRRGSGRNQVLAVNPDPRESDLELIPADVLRMWQGSGREPASAATSEPGLSRQGLWHWLLRLALLAAFAEALVANRYLSSKSEAP